MKKIRNQQRTRMANTVLMTANLLSKKAYYTNVANSLPAGSVLILTPTPALSKQRSALSAAAHFLRSSGHLVRTLPSSQVAG